MLSVILPSYNEEKMIFTAADTISGVLSRENIDFELLFVTTAQRTPHGKTLQRPRR